MRRHAFPTGLEALALFSTDAGLKYHNRYREATAGALQAALELVIGLAVKWPFANKARFPTGTVYLAPHAKEASGDNAIPQTLAAVCATIFQGVVDREVVLINAGRNPDLLPDRKDVRLLKERFQNDFTEIFGIEPVALTANEARYLVGFRSLDEIRDYLAKAREEIDSRLRSKGIFRKGVPATSLPPGVELSPINKPRQLKT